MKLLLDTCTFLWALGGTGDLRGRAADAFRAPDNEVYLSAASAWEIAIKYASGRLVLPRPPDRLITVEREARAILSLPIDEESALHVSRLPNLHRDPFDRLLVAQAIVHGLTILTPDPLVTQYPARTMW
jgi:PIN domain nuclease of toxin-antitoxin system